MTLGCDVPPSPAPPSLHSLSKFNGTSFNMVEEPQHEVPTPCEQEDERKRKRCGDDLGYGLRAQALILLLKNLGRLQKFSGGEGNLWILRRHGRRHAKHAR